MSVYNRNSAKHGCNVEVRKATQPNTMNDQWMTIEDAANYLGKAQNTLKYWCEAGKIAAIPTEYGTKISWRIATQSVIAMKESLKTKEVERIYKKTTKKVVSSQLELVSLFLKFCEQGLHNADGNPYSPETIKIHRYYLTYFLEKYGELSFHNVRAELLELPKEKFGKRQKIHRVMTAFGVWLVQEEMFDAVELEKIRRIPVKRHTPAKQVALREEQIDAIENACRNAFERALVIVLSETGLRNSEFRTLTMKAINLTNREIKTVGKGGKERWVGLTKKAYDALIAYIDEYGPFTDDEPLFKNRDGNLMTRYGLRDRIQRIAERVGIEAYPHAMRRSFVTNNIAKGRNIVDLQLACGHNQISTTRMYCRTEQVDVVNRMKDWD